MRRIIVICFSFPPQSGIGGRRWAKFAKYFKRSGIDFKIITTAPMDWNSEWAKDVETYKDQIISLPSGYPAILRSKPKSFFEKLSYRFQSIRLSVLSDGNFYDHSLCWSKRLMPEIENLIAEGYTTVIASGGPFHYLYELSKLKSKYGDRIKLVADFRDPWTTNRTSFGYAELATPRFKIEQEKERQVIQAFDCVVCVAQEMTDHFAKLISNPMRKVAFKTIMNGFDPDELISNVTERREDKFQFVFVGTLYRKAQKSIEAFSLAVSALNEANIEFHFYGDRTEEANAVLTKTNHVYLHSTLKLNDAHEVMLNADVAMLFITDDLTYSFSTKFCEYIAYKKPIWVVSKFGKTPGFILKNKIGYHSLTDIESISLFLNEFHKNAESKLSEIDYETFDSSPFNLKNLSEQYLELLN